MTLYCVRNCFETERQSLHNVTCKVQTTLKNAYKLLLSECVPHCTFCAYYLPMNRTWGVAMDTAGGPTVAAPWRWNFLCRQTTDVLEKHCFTCGKLVQVTKFFVKLFIRLIPVQYESCPAAEFVANKGRPVCVRRYQSNSSTVVVVTVELISYCTVICTDYQMLRTWSHEGGWDGLSTMHLRGE